MQGSGKVHGKVSQRPTTQVMGNLTPKQPGIKYKSGFFKSLRPVKTNGEVKLIGDRKAGDKVGNYSIREKGKTKPSLSAKSPGVKSNMKITSFLIDAKQTRQS